MSGPPGAPARTENGRGLLADKVLSQADAAKVKAAIADIESSLNKTP